MMSLLLLQWSLRARVLRRKIFAIWEKVLSKKYRRKQERRRSFQFFSVENRSPSPTSSSRRVRKANFRSVLVGQAQSRREWRRAFWAWQRCGREEIDTTHTFLVNFSWHPERNINFIISLSHQRQKTQQREKLIRLTRDSTMRSFTQSISIGRAAVRVVNAICWTHFATQTMTSAQSESENCWLQTWFCHVSQSQGSHTL